MTGIALVAVTALAALAAAAVHAFKRRRRDVGHGPLAMASPGGRAFAAHVGSLSDFRMELRLPRRR